MAYARAAAAADFYADLARQANRLLAAPKLRGKDADMMMAIFPDDAQPAAPAKRQPTAACADTAAIRSLTDQLAGK
ncbi:hypothetical protein QA641_06605 [Bradyrhizobium sp. CB1650]|uniref:hypothetical protein n=1 Tax=Bradyrhizobium sp. CB1650 TaxID=3039153 RepID=UPI002435F972|nr:hypothetical protein [Bradyrhizobium sp. CB1650]WGD53576.1 hypothetical protein QA641_06605 [Bradyrhizobium sp. CB1650]